jgi:serine/threonine protein kinase
MVATSRKRVSKKLLRERRRLPESGPGGKRMLGDYEVLAERDISGGGLDLRVRGSGGREFRLWVGCPGSGEGNDPQELQARLARVYHTSLPRVLGSEVIEGRAVLRLEAYHGETLRDRLAGAALSTPEALDVARSIAAGLVKAHAKGLEHGAITADEILLSEDGRTLLLHVGFAPFLAARPSLAPSPDPALGAGDVFALSRVLVEALEGRDPFDGSDSFLAGARDEHGFDPALPEGLRRLLARAISPDPDRRMTRAEELAGDLGVLRASWDSIVASGSGDRPARRPGILAILALVAVLLGALWVALRAIRG